MQNNLHVHAKLKYCVFGIECHARLVVIAILLFLTACGSNQIRGPVAYDVQRPRSILVMPPQNASIEVNAPYVLLSTLTRPLAEKGFYVFPVVVVDTFFKENGLPTPFEMNQIPLDEIRQHTDADAVLYTEIKKWGRQYHLISSQFVIDGEMKLVDVDSGNELWGQSFYVQDDESGGYNGGGLTEALLGAVVDQVLGSLFDSPFNLARKASESAIEYGGNALFKGPYRYTEAP